MAPSLEELGIDRLTVEDRIALVQDILDSVVCEQNRLTLSPAQRDELQRRLAEDRASPNDVVPWEQVDAELQARLQQ